MKLKLYSPLKDYFINQKFGENATSIYAQLGMKGHNGLDLRATDGTDVFASHSGTVTYAGLDGSNGYLVVIKTDEQFEYEGGVSFFKTLYGHLKTGSIVVTASQKVSVGQKIAQADNTGASTGSHLHFGLKPVQQGEQDWQWFNLVQDNGYNGAIDPEPYMVTSFIPFTREMKYGEFSDDIKTMQAFFLRIGLMSPIPPDEFGFYGNKTARAVKSFMVQSGKLSIWETLFWQGKNTGKKTLAELNLKYR